MATPTKKQLSARHVRRLRTLRKQALELAGQWEEIDQFCANRLVELADQVEKCAVDLMFSLTFPVRLEELHTMARAIRIASESALVAD
jgi:hypothetical protein